MFLTTALLLASTALAAPLAPLHTLLARDSHHCDLSTVHLTLPSEPELTVPDGQTLQVAAVAVGVQNYTCTDGLWVASGALADLYDVACALTASGSETNYVAANLPQWAFDNIPFPSPYDSGVDIKHEFVTTDTGIAPKFTRISDGAFVVGSLAGKVDVEPGVVIPWIRLSSSSLHGAETLAETVLRTDTVKGLPPTPECARPGNVLRVPYAANYYFLS